ncbi:unnamed protein product, partial [Ixodes pacificus]
MELSDLQTDTPGGRSLRNPKKFLPVPCPLTVPEWWRVALDEAQMVEGAANNTSRMALKLSAVNRWCVTGTPIQKSLQGMAPPPALSRYRPRRAEVFFARP